MFVPLRFRNPPINKEIRNLVEFVIDPKDAKFESKIYGCFLINK